MKFKKTTPEYIFHCQVLLLFYLSIYCFISAIQELNSKNKFEHSCVLYCIFQSAVMSSCFAKFHPNLVLGGTYSGQIVLWDNRSSKRTPVQRSPLSAAAHTVRFIYCSHILLLLMAKCCPHLSLVSKIN